MSKRKSTGKRQRFEIFKRDGFRCVYCGATPMQGPLHLDHVDPVANGGLDEPSNLVTACANCNLGKSSIRLTDKKLGTMQVTDADREQAEQIREYLAVQRDIAKARNTLVDEALAYWKERVGDVPYELPPRVPGMLREFGCDRLFEAFDIVGRKFPDMKYSGLTRYDETKSMKYLHGILRNWRQTGEAA